MITPVPVGYCEFCYIVDGRVTVSQKHPTTKDKSRNWRNVYGPPLKPRPPLTFQDRLYIKMDRLADGLHAFIVASMPMAQPAPKRRKLRKSPSERVLEDVENARTLTKATSTSQTKITKGWPLALKKSKFYRFFVLVFRIFLACVLTYGTVVFCLRLRQILR